jgi:hypothetical protein
VYYLIMVPSQSLLRFTYSVVTIGLNKLVNPLSDGHIRMLLRQQHLFEVLFHPRESTRSPNQAPCGTVVLLAICKDRSPYHSVSLN